MEINREQYQDHYTTLSSKSCAPEIKNLFWCDLVFRASNETLTTDSFLRGDKEAQDKVSWLSSFANFKYLSWSYRVLVVHPMGEQPRESAPVIERYRCWLQGTIYCTPHELGQRLKNAIRSARPRRNWRRWARNSTSFTTATSRTSPTSPSCELSDLRVYTSHWVETPR